MRPSDGLALPASADDAAPKGEGRVPGRAAADLAQTSPVPPAAAPPTPPRVNDLRLHPEIDGFTLVMTPPLPPFLEGGFGRVYRALSADGMLVAIKVPRPSLQRGPDAAEVAALWAHECSMSRRLPPHEHVVTFFPRALARWPDGSTSEALVMEWLDGARSLNRYCDAVRLDKPERVSLLLQAIEGVAWMHAHGTPHCDLKSANMLVVERAGRPVVKITDFGGTRKPGGLDPRAATYSVHRAAPELIADDPAAISARADVYALGKELAELIGGPAATAVQDDHHTAWRPQPLARFTGLADSMLDEIIARATAREPVHRYADAAELHAVLSRYVPPVHQRATRRAERWLMPAKLGPEARWSWPRVALVVLLLSAACAWLSREACRWVVQTGYGPWLTWSAEPPVAFERVAVVRARDADELLRVAEAQGIQGVSATVPATRRLVWRRVIETLVPVRPAVIAIDVRFEKAADPAMDRVIGEGIRAATHATPDPVPVVVAVPDWQSVRPDLRAANAIAAEVIDAGAQWGSIGVPELGGVGAALVMAQSETGRMRAPFAVVAAAAALGGGEPVEVALDREALSLVLRRGGDEGQAIPLFSLRRREEIPGEAFAGVGPRDWVGLYPVGIPPSDQAFAGADMGVEEFFRLSPAERHARLAGRVVILAAYDPADEAHDFGGRTIRGAWLHAAAIESLLQGIPGRRTSWLWLVPAAAAAMLGALVAAALVAPLLGRLGLRLLGSNGRWPDGAGPPVRPDGGSTPNAPPALAVARRWRLAAGAWALLTSGAAVAGATLLPGLVPTVSWAAALLVTAGALGAAAGALSLLAVAWMGVVRRAWCL